MSDGTWTGLYRGVVVSTADFATAPHRLTVAVPQVTGSLGVPALPCFPYPKSKPEFPAPEVGEGIWVMFENGDLNYPVWLGFFGSRSV